MKDPADATAGEGASMFHGLVDSGFVYEKYAEEKHDGMRLGRNQWLDGRSLAYMVENDAKEMGRRLEDQHWERVLAILDQGQLGSCTGNAGTGALGTQPFYDAVGKSVLPSATDAAAAEEFAVQLYKDATVADGYPGTYPPDDTGSSGLAICKVLKKRGVISRYRWAHLLRAAPPPPGRPGAPRHALVQRVLEPNKHGFIDAHRSWPGSGVAGGHEIEAVGVEIDTKDALNSVLIYANSWGTGWGDRRLLPHAAAHLRGTARSGRHCAPTSPCCRRG